MYQVLGDQVRDSKEIGKMIMEHTGFTVEEDLCHASKREDVLAWRLGVPLIYLQKEEPGDEEAMSALMEKTDELVKGKISSLLESRDEILSYAYTYDEGRQKILSVVVVMDESNAQRKMRDVVKRLLRV